ncbi:hypothetical protein B296_00055999 [Ensete ventricosum]|uniref:Uncharacterized protein n=1 Tax=Ensete ventricosum TaxID=4639 RepID=A0A426XMB1_ENSVE|nr:hypothetical protein B296_00055999 [Ensete ventricosum]
MGSYCCEAECPVSSHDPKRKRANKKKKKKGQRRAQGTEEMAENGRDGESAWLRRSRPGGGGAVMLEGYVEAAEGLDLESDVGGGGVGRTRSLTDDDLVELKGCLDLGFGFSYDEIPELCHTLPALELCYSMSRSLEVDGNGAAAEPCAASVASLPISNWKISSPVRHTGQKDMKLKNLDAIHLLLEQMTA